MKKSICLIVIFLSVFSLVSCKGSESISNTDNSDPSEEINQFQDDTQYALEVEYLTTSIKQYYMAPYIVGDELVATSTENYEDEENAKTIIYNLSTESEIEVDIFSQDPKLYNGFIYYANHSLDHDDQTMLIKRDRESGKEKTIYTVQGDHKRIGLSLGLSNKYLGWYEVKDDADIYVSDSDERVGMVCDLVIFDLDTEKVVYKAEDTAVFTPFNPPEISSDNKVVQVDVVDEKCIVSIIDFQTSESIYALETEAIPMFLDYDNQKLTLLYRGLCIQVIDIFTSEEIISISGAFSQAHIIDGRFLVYGSTMEVYVFDLNTKEIIYDSKDKNEEYEGDYRYHHHGAFTVNRETKQAVYRMSDRANQKSAIVVLISFKEM